MQDGRVTWLQGTLAGPRLLREAVPVEVGGKSLSPSPGLIA